MWAIVPLKSFEAAKQRLASVLSLRERRELMLAMARDVLTALCRSEVLTGVLIVSRTPEADALAQAFSTERFAESPDADLPGALTQASAHLTGHFGARGVVVVPADVPRIDPTELDALLAGHDSVTVVPDAANSGTNCLILSPPDVIGFVFDGKSFRPHVDAAFARGLTPRVVPARRFALDIDTAADLRELLGSAPATQTASFLIRSGIARRLEDTDNGEPQVTT
jgi:2-phospho-L-lactate guanylyltransferase